MEAKLQKLKVTELKDLLSKHNLPQSGKKDDLVKRLVENGIGPETEEEEELVDIEGEDIEPPAEEEQPVEENTGVPSNTEPIKETQPSSTDSEQPTLTPDQQAMKARAERFGIPFNPNATPSQRQKPTTKSTSTTDTTTQSKSQKNEPITSAPVGISEEVLAKRAAKFGLPEKKEKEKENGGGLTKKDEVTKSNPKSTQEVTPEMAEKIAAEEEKKRKRAEKFGTGKPSTTSTNGSSEPDAKKSKV